MSKVRPLSIQLQDRDIALLRDLFESRLMTLAHVAALHFDGKPEAAKKRVQKLKTAGLIRERPRRSNEPSIVFLTREALKLLSEDGHIADYPELSLKALEKRAQVSDMTLRHELELIAVKAAIRSAIRQTTNFSIAEFSTWPMLYQFKAKCPDGETVLVKPDAFIRIREDEPDGLSEHTFFLELDRSSEPQKMLLDKAECYLDYYRTGGLAKRFGRPEDEYKLFPFRVLFVLQNGERRDTTAKRLLGARILSQVWLTTLSELLTNPLGAIWVRPKDYQAPTLGKHRVLDHTV
jgi:hypothetical protein